MYFADYIFSVIKVSLIMASKLWATSEDGSIKYVSLSNETLKSALDCMRNSFYLHENVSKAVGLPGNSEGVAELEELTLKTARDGISIAAVDTTKNKVCGISFNKLQVKTSGEEASYFENYAKSCKNSSSRDLVMYMSVADANCDLFELCKADCLMEIMFLATLPEYRGKGIATKLCEVSIELAKELHKGNNVKQSLDDTELPLEPIPKIVSSLFTSNISQKIGRRLAFHLAATESFDNYTHEGKTFSSVIGPETPYYTLEYKTL